MDFSLFALNIASEKLIHFIESALRIIKSRHLVNIFHPKKSRTKGGKDNAILLDQNFNHFFKF